MNLLKVTRACWAMTLMLLVSGCQSKPTEDELTQALQDRIDAAYSHVSEARDQLSRLDNDNWQDAVSKTRESTQAAFVDIENAQYALKKLKDAQ
jgi:outer membrane murein-binding lipoprotein Lpp